MDGEDHRQGQSALLPQPGCHPPIPMQAPNPRHQQRMSFTTRPEAGEGGSDEGGRGIARPPAIQGLPPPRAQWGGRQGCCWVIQNTGKLDARLQYTGLSRRDQPGQAGSHQVPVARAQPCSGGHSDSPSLRWEGIVGEARVPTRVPILLPKCCVTLGGSPKVSCDPEMTVTMMALSP